MFAFGGENVTRGNLKNLVTDKPSPITVALAQVKANATANATANITMRAPGSDTFEEVKGTVGNQTGIPGCSNAKNGQPCASPPMSREDARVVSGMAGTEEIHGAGTVGGNAVQWAQKKSISK
jgi:hypothetical protein